jgi:hypothetical protein
VSFAYSGDTSVVLSRVVKAATAWVMAVAEYHARGGDLPADVAGAVRRYES